MSPTRVDGIKMGQPDVKVLSLNVPCDRHAPRAIRQALHESVEIGEALGDAVLVASELVTNAVLHSGCSEYDAIEVTVRLGAERVLIIVHDPGFSGRTADARESDLSGGWGLQIVGQLAQRWGAEQAGGYRVWAEMATPNSQG